MAAALRPGPRFGRILLAAAALAAAAYVMADRHGNAIGLPDSAPDAQPPKAAAAPRGDGGAQRQADAPEAADAADVAASFAAFFAALDAGDARKAAADLRRALRTDEAAFAEALALLLDGDTSPERRQALAMVLGTLPKDGVDDALLAALARFGDDEPTALAVIAALGALRDPPEEDDVFDLEAAPHFGVRGPGGIGITVRNVITDSRAERALCDLLLDKDRREVRLAAASALQWSMEQEMSRTRFRTALQLEMDDAAAAVLGEALGLWTRRKQGVEPDQVVQELVDAAARAGLDEYRLRLETALQQAPLAAASQQRLLDMTHPAQPFALRCFALQTLARQEPLPADARATIVAAASDADPALRRQAARMLGELPHGDDAAGALQSAFAQRADWSLRLVALVALARTLPTAARLSLLRAAAQDEDARVAARARRLLEGG